MGRTLETKQRILELLSSDKKNLTELRTELGLSPSTVSQHLKELEARGAIYLILNEHFRRYKYYRAVHEFHLEGKQHAEMSYVTARA